MALLLLLSPIGGDEDALVASAQGYADGDFTKVNAAPIPGSQHAGEHVNVWVSNDALETYLSINPDDDTSTASFASGTMLVKEQLTGDGELSALTVMAKGPEGYDPETNDWWWARIETSGDVPFSGNVSFCVGCHTPAKEATDWVFGVHLEDRAE